jgi:hypothetical protein
MACGAFPIISPLDTITQVVQNEKNVLFARNLDSQEIADAIVRAMNDDTLVDSVTEENLRIVRKIANRTTIRRRVIKNYQNIGS